MSNATSRIRGQKQIKVFLSYAYTDVVNARRIRDLLIHHLGLQVFSHGDLSAGENWKPKLRKALENADVFVALITPNSIADSWLLQETGAAWGLDKPIVPLVSRLDILDRFPIQLRSYPALDLKDLDTAKGSERFAEALNRALNLTYRRASATRIRDLETMNFAVIYEKTSTGCSAYVPDLPGCAMFGETAELIRGAIEIHPGIDARGRRFHS